jgi:hypothetical protein
VRGGALKLIAMVKMGKWVEKYIKKTQHDITLGKWR